MFYINGMINIRPEVDQLPSARLSFWRA